MGLEGGRLGEEEKASLERCFDEEEIKSVVWNCGTNKSPGPDGFGSQFFRTCWNVVKEDLFLVFEEFHRHGRICKGMNSTFITLIPKVKKPGEFE